MKTKVKSWLIEGKKRKSTGEIRTSSTSNRVASSLLFAWRYSASSLANFSSNVPFIFAMMDFAVVFLYFIVSLYSFWLLGRTKRRKVRKEKRKRKKTKTRYVCF